MGELVIQRSKLLAYALEIDNTIDMLSCRFRLITEMMRSSLKHSLLEKSLTHYYIYFRPETNLLEAVWLPWCEMAIPSFSQEGS